MFLLARAEFCEVIIYLVVALNALIVISPERVSEKWAYIGDMLTFDILLSSRDVFR